ncbi:MAG: alkaline phosphatase D family protein [Verrucomicrobiota bacterium]|nr:alkaline phosphatase D family protein [Verrucomicrobiota bacterium]
MKQPTTRRTFLKSTAVLAGGALLPSTRAAAAAPPHQATGVKVGEVTDTTAIVWTRLTARPTRLSDGIVISGTGRKGAAKVTVPADQIEGACPGAPGRIRVRYGAQEDLRDARETEWIDVSAVTDFTHHFSLTGLPPDRTCHYAVETTGPGGSPQHGVLRGRFDTAPPRTAPGNFRFCVMTCQGYPDRDHPDGHPIYPAMLALAPKFVSMTGDVVYYDNDEPRAVNPALARLHWERMFSLPRQVELLRNTASYWLKDDHDTLDNDSWPGSKMGQLTFAEGQRIFREQTPMSGPGYRTFRWSRDLQIWLTDGRDHRSRNNLPDGPNKTIWGAEQKAWFKETVKASDATWKVLISPTPIVGPDRGKKNDNHANAGFTHEGDELRAWMQAYVPDNFFVLCGDRHWQYHSVHPETGVREFSVGAASDSHAGGTPGEDPRYHRFHRVKGGFLSVQLTAAGAESRIAFRHHDVNGRVVHEYTATRPTA